nr:MAG TPA: hypothetical protein [Caudoviricetes sp.]
MILALMLNLGIYVCCITFLILHLLSFFVDSPEYNRISDNIMTQLVKLGLFFAISRLILFVITIFFKIQI